MIIYQTNPAPMPPTWQKLTIDEMAATMQDMDANGEATTKANLLLRGYSVEEIERYGYEAAHLARERATKLVIV